ncbi:MAG: DNA polymerase III subunit gamma/tau [candidate division WOR-3 bacterium]
MSGKVLTLKYRPQTFDELLVQNHVKRVLIKALEHRRLANAYLFAGPRGVGKTTTARILAKSLNCLSFEQPTPTPCNRCSACVEISGSRNIDVLEIDGASNRGIDQVRELRENIKYAPTSLRYKVYIIDEVHMLTSQAFNALLKTLEEPPAHAKFIFATTAAHEVPATIISRCQRFDFRKASPEEVATRLRWLAEQENIKIAESALLAVARRADGAIRDGESILEQLATYQPGGIELSDVEELLGLVPAELFFEFLDSLLAGSSTDALRLVARIVEEGHDLFEFYSGLVCHLRNLLVLIVSSETRYLGTSQEEIGRLAEQAKAAGSIRLVKALETVLRSEESAKHSQIPRVHLECLTLELSALLGPEPAGTQIATGTSVDAETAQTRKTTAALRPPDAASSRTKKQEVATRHSKTDDPSRPLDSVWEDFILRIKGHKPYLATFLHLCKAESHKNNTFTISCPETNRTAWDKLQNDISLLESVLSSVLGQPTKVTIVPSKGTNDSSPEIERISRVFGPLERISRHR